MKDYIIEPFHVALLIIVTAFITGAIAIIAVIDGPTGQPEHAIVIDASENIEIKLDNGSRVFIKDEVTDDLHCGQDISVKLDDGHYHLLKED